MEKNNYSLLARTQDFLSYNKKGSDFLHILILKIEYFYEKNPALARKDVDFQNYNKEKKLFSDQRKQLCENYRECRALAGRNFSTTARKSKQRKKEFFRFKDKQSKINKRSHELLNMIAILNRTFFKLQKDLVLNNEIESLSNDIEEYRLLNRKVIEKETVLRNHIHALLFNQSIEIPSEQIMKSILVKKNNYLDIYYNGEHVDEKLHGHIKINIRTERVEFIRYPKDLT